MGSSKKDETEACQSYLQQFRQGQRYRPVQNIGEGGAGKVVSSFDTYLNRVVAIKTLRKEKQKRLRSLQAIIKEVRLISYLDHPGVVSIYDAFINREGQFTYTMKLIEGENLESLLYRPPNTDLPLTQYIQVFTKLFETLAYTHDKGVIHLDLKPANIMLGEYGEVSIVDWGNARLYDEELYTRYLQTYGNEDRIYELQEREKYVSGTPKYMSPEQISNERSILTPASDIFSAGVFFYELLTKKHPFPAENLSDLVDQLHYLDPEPMHEVRPSLPKRLSQICSKMLAKNPAERYQSCREVLQDLQSFLQSGHTFETRHFESDAIIFRENDPGGYAFVVKSGLVEITTEVNGERKFLATLGEGEIIGELSIFNKRNRSATARTLTPTIIQIINEANVLEELEKLSPWIGKMITSLSGRFTRLSRRYIEETSDSENKSSPKAKT